MQQRAQQICHSLLTRALIAMAGLAILIGFTSPGKAQAQAVLRKIEIVGLQQLSADRVISLTGLQLGQTVNAAAFDAASDKLMKSGLFRAVAYHVRNADGDITVIFEVTEKPSTAPVAGGILGQVTWVGNRALTVTELSTAFGLRTGDTADRVKLDNALDAVRRAYARKGYVAAQISESRTPDAASRRANYQFTVREGAQYRMGTLAITGLSVPDTQRLKTKWTLAPGAVFNDAYLDDFKQNVVRPFVMETTQRTGVRSKFDLATRPDARKQTVDVVINFR